MREEKRRGGEVREEKRRGGEVREEKRRGGEVREEKRRGGEVREEKRRGGEVREEKRRGGEAREEKRRGGEGHTGCVCGLTNKSSRYCKLQLVLFGKERDDLGEDGLALYLAVCRLGHNARPHLNLLAHLERGGEGRGGRKEGQKTVNGGITKKCSLHPLSPPLHPLSPPLHPLSPPLHPLSPPLHPLSPMIAVYSSFGNFGGKIFWRIAENMPFGGIYFGG